MMGFENLFFLLNEGVQMVQRVFFFGNLYRKMNKIGKMNNNKIVKWGGWSISRCLEP